jgi:hypothetical protein
VTVVHAERPNLLSRLRSSYLALPVLIAAPVPIAVALLVTARPYYPPDSCAYGAPRSSLLATDHYLATMTPLGMVALAAVAAIGLPIKGRWGLIAPIAAAWAVAALLWTDAAHPLVVFGAHLTVFGLFLGVPIIVIAGVAGHEYGWVRAIGWFELLFLLPLLLGVAGLLAQPSCYAGDPPAPIPR